MLALGHLGVVPIVLRALLLLSVNHAACSKAIAIPNHLLMLWLPAHVMLLSAFLRFCLLLASGS
jgi:hypothetical protein